MSGLSSSAFPPLPDSLSGHEARGIQPGLPVAQFEIGSYRNFVYLIIDWGSRQAAVVDPQADLAPLDEALSAHRLSLSAIFLTHSHFDHIAGVPELLRRSPRLPIYVHPGDAYRLAREHRANVTPIHGGQKLGVGGLEIDVLHTPGHSVGECSYFISSREDVPPFLFTGDTVFIRDCGRTDLETGSNEQLFASLQRIKSLPPETVILPGHHYQRECASTLARERAESPPFLCQNVQELASLP
jgi:glyoxylase-like metal-dependent hydrolase (beta-lactamase superfamily II)